MTIREVQDMFLYVSKKMIESEPILTEIDLKIGDGDHGVGIAIGFRGVENKLNNSTYLSINKIFKDIGFTLLAEMGGASGVLFGTIFISGIVNYPPKDDFTLNDFTKVFSKGLEALKERGKAKIGDKTMIDSLEPAVLSLKASVNHKVSMEKAFLLATNAALDGVEMTKMFPAKFGRAKYYREKSIGFQDAGATSIYLMMRSMSEWMSKKKVGV